LVSHLFLASGSGSFDKEARHNQAQEGYDGSKLPLMAPAIAFLHRFEVRNHMPSLPNLQVTVDVAIIVRMWDVGQL
jgi:hypothetical protein